MTGVRQAFGAWGERTAEQYLRVSGITVIARNWRCPKGEIDLIGLDDEILVFYEVKTRRTEAFGTGFEAVLGRKALRLRDLALLWLEKNRGERRPIRFDVIAVTPVRHGPPRIEHMRGAF